MMQTYSSSPSRNLTTNASAPKGLIALNQKTKQPPKKAKKKE